MRHSALHPLGWSEEELIGPANGAVTTAYPGPIKNTGDDAWLFENKTAGTFSAKTRFALLSRPL